MQLTESESLVSLAHCLSEIYQNLNDCRRQLQDEERRRTELLSRLQVVESELSIPISNLKTDLSNAQTEIGALRSKIAAKDRAIAEKMAEIDANRQRVVTRHVEREDTRKLLDGLAKQNNDMQDRFNEREKALTKAALDSHDRLSKAVKEIEAMRQVVAHAKSRSRDIQSAGRKRK